MTAPVGEVSSATARGRNGNRALALRVEGALSLEPALQLLQARPQLADVVELDLVDDEAEPPRLVVEVDPAAEHEHLAVLRQRRHPARVVGEKDRRRSGSTPSWIVKLKWPAAPRFMPLTSPFTSRAVSGRSSRGSPWRAR